METLVATLGILLIHFILLAFLPALISLMRGTHRFGALIFNVIAFPLLVVVPPIAVIVWLIALGFAVTGSNARTEVVLVRDRRDV